MIKYNTLLDFTKHWESYRPYPYPDPASELAQKSPFIKWGTRPPLQILNQLPSLKEFRGAPWTAGWGTIMCIKPGGRIAPVAPDTTYSLKEATDWLERDLIVRRLAIKKLNPSLSSRVVDSLCDYAYNYSLQGSPILVSKIKTGTTHDIADELLDAFKANGTYLMGLLLRRISEYNLCLYGVYIAYEKPDAIPDDILVRLTKRFAYDKNAMKLIKLLRDE